MVSKMEGVEEVHKEVFGSRRMEHLTLGEPVVSSIFSRKQRTQTSSLSIAKS
jgi:hypothetical protein